MSNKEFLNNGTRKNGDDSRRSFLKKAAVATITLASTDLITFATDNASASVVQSAGIPWYRRITRWGQTNITEKDPSSYDIPWWRNHWKNTETQGVIINAGGIVAYYPSKIPLHRQAQFLEGRDLFGSLCQAAHEENVAVFARMDSNRAHEEFYRLTPIGLPSMLQENHTKRVICMLPVSTARITMNTSRQYSRKLQTYIILKDSQITAGAVWVAIRYVIVRTAKKVSEI
jgi:hypothetical protein